MRLEIGGRILEVDTGRVAYRADSSWLVRYGDTLVLTTVCKDIKEPDPPPNFIPLTCDYLERMYAAGIIPGGFFKREGRPTQKEILTSRLIDRPIRPLFPHNLLLPVQIIATVLSSDRQNDGDILSIIGASLALRTSNIPFNGPIGVARVGLIGNDFILNPITSELEESSLNLVVSCSRAGINMIEASAKEVSEEVIVSAIKFALPEVQRLIEFQEQIPSGEKLEPAARNTEELKNLIAEKAWAHLDEALKIKERIHRSDKLHEIENSLIAELKDKYAEHDILKEFEELRRNMVRQKILKDKSRIDGRGLDELRPISCEVNLLPRAHGSALFTRGETQSLSTITLGTMMDEQKIEELTGESYKSFIVHYNFPPFSVGEVDRLRGPGRREIGHGALAERALASVTPNNESFPYTIRIVSDILSSNASSSMATVCAGSLALMDAGVPIKTHVAGVSLGLVEDTILVDIIGEEDYFGDMDFKLAGTRSGLTAIQLDIKREGLKLELIERALKIGKGARLKILGEMEKTISVPRKETSEYAPKLNVMSIPKDKIGLVIGPGGKVIREIIEKTGAKIEISDEGKVTISSDSWQTTEAARKIIEGIVEEVEIGKNYIGIVKKIMPFGAFVEILPGKEGMIHISQLAPYRVQSPEDVVKVGEEVPVKVIGIDEQGKIQLSRKALIR